MGRKPIPMRLQRTSARSHLTIRTSAYPAGTTHNETGNRVVACFMLIMGMNAHSIIARIRRTTSIAAKRYLSSAIALPRRQAAQTTPRSAPATGWTSVPPNKTGLPSSHTHVHTHSGSRQSSTRPQKQNEATFALVSPSYLPLACGKICRSAFAAYFVSVPNGDDTGLPPRHAESLEQSAKSRKANEYPHRSLPTFLHNRRTYAHPKHCFHITSPPPGSPHLHLLGLDFLASGASP